jgi:hypothetical protein
MVLQASRRIAGTRRMDGDNFTRTGSAAIGVSLRPREFLRLCLAENDRRFAPYDRRLLRPRAMAAVARTLAALLPRPARSAPLTG